MSDMTTDTVGQVTAYRRLLMPMTGCSTLVYLFVSCIPLFVATTFGSGPLFALHAPSADFARAVDGVDEWHSQSGGSRAARLAVPTGDGLVPAASQVADSADGGLMLVTAGPGGSGPWR
jgi:hypothetical protein